MTPTFKTGEMFAETPYPFLYVVTTDGLIKSDDPAAEAIYPGHARLAMDTGAAKEMVDLLPGIDYIAANAIVSDGHSVTYNGFWRYHFVMAKQPGIDSSRNPCPYGVGLLQTKIDPHEPSYSELIALSIDLMVIYLRKFSVLYWAAGGFTVRMNYPGIGAAEIRMASIIFR